MHRPSIKPFWFPTCSTICPARTWSTLALAIGPTIPSPNLHRTQTVLSTLRRYGGRHLRWTPPRLRSHQSLLYSINIQPNQSSSPLVSKLIIIIPILSSAHYSPNLYHHYRPHPTIDSIQSYRFTIIPQQICRHRIRSSIGSISPAVIGHPRWPPHSTNPLHLPI